MRSSYPKKIFLALLVLFAFSGCSKSGWRAKVHVVKAENAASKAYALRVKGRISYEERLKYYKTACENFHEAYREDPRVFTLLRIEIAADACLRVRDQEKVDLFEILRDEYIREHPTETEYGDAGVGMMLEG